RLIRPSSSIKSTRRNSARPCPITTSGSRDARSVHCSGSEQIVASSACSNRRLPYRLNRSPTQGSDCPPQGWKGWVTRTSSVNCVETPAFRDGLLRYQYHAGSVPNDQLYSVQAPGAEDKDIAAIWIGFQCFRDHRNQAMHTSAKIDRSRRNQNLQVT